MAASCLAMAFTRASSELGSSSVTVRAAIRLSASLIFACGEVFITGLSVHLKSQPKATLRLHCRLLWTALAAACCAWNLPFAACVGRTLWQWSLIASSRQLKLAMRLEDWDKVPDACLHM